MHATQESDVTETRWQARARADHYAGERFAKGHGDRDVRLVRRLIERFDADASSRELLDVPAGTGRLAAGLAKFGTACGVDVSAAMLEHSDYARDHRGLIADARGLPFVADTFDVCVACRLLHHQDDAALVSVLAELLRVSRRLVVVSFWDAASLPEWRKRLGLRKRTDARRSVSRRHFAELAARAGGEVLGHAASLRFVSPQTFAALRRKPR